MNLASNKYKYNSLRFLDNVDYAHIRLINHRNQLQELKFQITHEPVSGLKPANVKFSLPWGIISIHATRMVSGWVGSWIYI